MPAAGVCLNVRSCQDAYIVFKDAVSNTIFMINDWN
jgi:hypothetical protein